MGATKGDIISVALRLFAERGLVAVTVREICARAKVNLALVNYHFRNKEGLYQACLDYLFHEGTGEALTRLDAGVCDAKSWRVAVTNWIKGYSQTLTSTVGVGALSAGFYRQEMINPSPMRELIRRRYVKPIHDCLNRLIAMAVDDLDDRRHWVESIWAQLSSAALVDAAWHPIVSPGRGSSAGWNASMADFVCRHVLSELQYQAH